VGFDDSFTNGGGIIRGGVVSLRDKNWRVTPFRTIHRAASTGELMRRECSCRAIPGERERETEREGDRETDRERERDRERQNEREGGRGGMKQRVRDREKESRGETIQVDRFLHMKHWCSQRLFHIFLLDKVLFFHSNNNFQVDKAIDL
jgi:hypothetical protein